MFGGGSVVNRSDSNKRLDRLALAVALLLLWIIFRVGFKVYSADKWKTVRISKCHCQISYPLYWLDSSNNATRGRGLDEAVSWHVSAILVGTNKATIFFHPTDAPSSEGLEDWMTETLIAMRADHVVDEGEQVIGKANIAARYKTYQLSDDYRIYYFFAEDGYYAIEFYSKNFSKHEEMFAHILASFEILE